MKVVIDPLVKYSLISGEVHLRMLKQVAEMINACGLHVVAKLTGNMAPLHSLSPPYVELKVQTSIRG